MPSIASRLIPVFVALACSGAAVAAPAAPLAAQGSIPVPGQPLKQFDISAANGAGGLYALADRSNAAVDVFNTSTGRFAWRTPGFVGAAAGGSDVSGPNGLAFVGPHQLWAGDGNSSVKVIDLATHHVVASVATGGRKRVDELAYDPQDHLVLAANNADQPAFASFISTRPPYRVVARLTLPQASSGLEQPVWDPGTHLFYLAIPALDGHAAKGGVAVIDPHSHHVLRIDAVHDCEPAGLALGPQQHLLVGCSDDAVAHGFAARSIVLDAATGRVLATLRQVGGSDEVTYDPRTRTFDLAAVANPGGPVLGVIDAVHNRWLANLPSGPHAHSVGADGASGDVFVPIAAGSADRLCPSGCIRVYAPHS